MPATVIASVAAQALVAHIGTYVAMSAFVTAALRAVIGVAIKGVLSNVLGGKKGESATTPAVQVQNRMVTVRQPVAPWQVIYGQARVGGVITYMYSSGSTLCMVITIAGHVVEEIGDIYFDDELVPLDGSGDVPTGMGSRYAGYAHVEKSLGSESGQPFPDLVTTSGGEWSNDHKQRGRAKLYVKLTFHKDAYPNGLPNISAVVKGRQVADPRVSPSADNWSANATLCLADYLTSGAFGVGADLVTEFDNDTLVAAANECDEQVELAGSPTEYENRYEINGAFTVDATPKDVIGQMLASMAGKAVHAGGQWHLFAGAYEAPTLTFDEDDLAGPIKVQALLSRRENANGVKGVFADPNANWQPTDFPAVASDTYLAEDGDERVWKDIDLSAFVTSGTQAQRLAKIELLSVRQGLTVTALFKLTAWQAMTGRTVALTNTRFGWSAKAFEVASSRFVAGSDGTLNVELVLRETAAEVFDWATSEEQSVDLAPNSNLPDPTANLDIAGLTASSGTADLMVNGDGTVVPRVRLRWTAPTNPFLKEYEIQIDRGSVSPSEWADCPKVLAGVTEGFAYPVKDGESVNLRIRAVTTFGNGGSWAYVYGHAVVGKTAAPSDVTGFSAQQQGVVIVFGASEVEDADLDLIEVRLADYGNTNWDDAQPVTNILRGQTVSSAAVMPGTWTFLAKARDTSGNYSANAVSYDLTVTSDGYTSIASQEQAPAWNGALTNMVRHWTGVLTPESQSLASALGWEVFDEFVPNAYADCYFEAAVIDKSLDASARVWADIVSVLGPGETTGAAAPSLEIDTRLAAGSFDGFLPWTIGTENFRYLKARIYVDTSVGKPVISGFEVNIDAASREETGTYTTGGGGSVAVTFANQFHSTPILNLTPQGSGDVSASYASLSASGFTGYFKSGGAAAAGTASYRAVGA